MKLRFSNPSIKLKSAKMKILQRNGLPCWFGFRAGLIVRLVVVLSNTVKSPGTVLHFDLVNLSSPSLL